jgi:hypothetical protein
MRTALAILLTLGFITLIAMPKKTIAQDDALKSRAELTNYEETSRYEDVHNFIAALRKRSPLLRVESFGKSEEGRDLPLKSHRLSPPRSDSRPDLHLASERAR